MLLGISLWPQNTTWTSLRGAGVLAETSGFDHLYTWDHFYAIAGDHENPNLECFSVLAAWGALTEHVKLGALVAGITYRHPAVLVNAITTIDHITNGRAIMGIGAAWNEVEHDAYGMRLGTRKVRSDRFEEAARVIRSMLREQSTSFEGKYYKLKDALIEPRPVQRELPILVGGGGERRTLRTTAMYADMWHGWGSPEDITHKMEVIARHCRTVGRDPREIAVLSGGWVVVRDHPDDAQAYLDTVAARHGITRPILRAGGDPDTVARRIAEWAKVGVRGFLLSGAEPFDRETIERMGREVKPRLNELLEA